MNETEYRPSGLMLSFEVTIESSRGVLAEESDRIMSIVKTLPCFHGDIANLRQALLEALANAVIHGNREDPAKRVAVCAGCTGPGQLLIAVTDQGCGFDPRALPDPTADDNIGLTHGRGVFLMRHLVDEVQFNMGGRQVVLQKRMR